MSKFKYLNVGAGLWGIVLAERIAKKLKTPALLIDKRKHSGWNCHSVINEESGIECHAYGTHIFHTKNEKVWSYINQFACFSKYRHRVWTTYKGKVYPMPISLATINNYYGLSLKPYEVDSFIRDEIGKEAMDKPKNLEEKAISLIGRPLYEAFIKGYTEKQWARPAKELPESIICRLPVRKNYNIDYFDDPWQGLPLDGYAAMFKKMLSNPLIRLELNCSYQSIKDKISKDCLVLYSGPIDELFDYSLCQLKWRSLRFENKIIPQADALGTSVMNQADSEIPYTRIHEYKHLHPERGEQGKKTVLAYEYPAEFKKGDIPYYPINTDDNQALADKYLKMTKKNKNLIVGGRLGSYRYLDMDKVIDEALTVFDEILTKKKQ